MSATTIPDRVWHHICSFLPLATVFAASLVNFVTATVLLFLLRINAGVEVGSRQSWQGCVMAGRNISFHQLFYFVNFFNILSVCARGIFEANSIRTSPLHLGSSSIGVNI